MRGLVSIVLCCGVAMAAGASDEGRENAVKRARQLVARELSTRVERIAVGSVEPAQWPDAALGCPVAGMQYAQVVTDGLRVLHARHRRSEERRVGKECRSLCDWSSDVCSSDLGARPVARCRAGLPGGGHAVRAGGDGRAARTACPPPEIGRASCRERV